MTFGTHSGSKQAAASGERPTLGWRQDAVFHALTSLGDEGGGLREVLSAYFEACPESERWEFDSNGEAWSREYDSVASALYNLKRKGLVSNKSGRWFCNGVPATPILQAARRKQGRHTSRVPEVRAVTLLREAIASQDVDLAKLIAATALWAPPRTGLAPTYERRRARPNRGERRRDTVENIRLDDNSYANKALKSALGRPPRDFVGFEVCHIWPKTCYDAKYHTLVANLVLLPRAVAGLSDHDEHVAACLQYRAYELYNWYPHGSDKEVGEQEAPPAKPEGYPDNWRDPGLPIEFSGDGFDTRAAA